MALPGYYHEIWGWDAGDFSKATYDAYVDTSNGFTLEANGRLTADNQTRTLSFTNALGVATEMNFPQGYEAPTCESDGSLTCWNKGDAGEVDPHCMFRPEDFPGSIDDWYFQPGYRYRADFDFDVSATTTWASQTWSVVLQLHPGTFPAGHNAQPPYAFYCLGTDDEFRAQVLGNTADTPTNQDPYPVVSENDYAFSTGNHVVVMEWLTDYTGQNSEFVLTDNGTERARVTTSGGLNYSGSSTSEARMVMTVGCYSSAQDLDPNYPSIKHNSCHIYRASASRGVSWF